MAHDKGFGLAHAAHEERFWVCTRGTRWTDQIIKYSTNGEFEYKFEMSCMDGRSHAGKKHFGVANYSGAPETGVLAFTPSHRFRRHRILFLVTCRPLKQHACPFSTLPRRKASPTACIWRATCSERAHSHPRPHGEVSIHPVISGSGFTLTLVVSYHIPLASE